VDGARLAVPQGKPSALLALLRLRRGELVSADAAIEALWPLLLPAHPDNALHLTVSRLRRALSRADGDGPNQAVVAIAGGYRLRVHPGAVDADRFETLAAAGRAQLRRMQPLDAANTLSLALQLWRGPALGALRDEPFATAHVARLEEQRTAGHTRCGNACAGS